MPLSEIKHIEMQLRDLKLKLIGIETDLKEAKKCPEMIRQFENKNTFRSDTELKTEHTKILEQIKYLESEKAQLENKRKAAKEKPKNVIVKEEFEKVQKANPQSTTEEILYKVADNLNDTFETKNNCRY